MRVIVPYVKDRYVQPISAVVSPGILKPSKRAVKLSVQVKSPFIKEFDLGASLKDVSKSCYAPRPFDDYVDSHPDYQDLSSFNQWIDDGAYKRKK